ncbi:hypothetical protein FUT69_04225 [Xylella taiwanensis]|uniref:Uncharacterized protein n=1 Tax=Xylella taiwanensis TaxID=1444770 RepID=Z9JGX4_9GAMM|nr:hypothetical protein [Xylella taiwanensis]AXI84400.1 hypothetical protein AB672_10905 [Xylella taiwanensis]EWS77036.1 hypothetical protein AF72_12980 [Xylella taiwanensis]MCD8455279.1 hypothetical protein [Xylella taiwanensis]MCD8457686.1 hypothetical protein [Xylella taiwanensis]MCD8459823.1 hypothetical protein [Xylella taiwanensis]
MSELPSGDIIKQRRSHVQPWSVAMRGTAWQRARHISDQQAMGNVAVDYQQDRAHCAAQVFDVEVASLETVQTLQKTISGKK